jgi:hypothetical protein
MKPSFSNLEVDFWIHPGKLGISSPSLCLSHDSTRAGTPILNAIKELKNEQCPARRKLTFSTCSRKRALSTLRLRLVPGREDLRVMSIRCDSDTATIEMTDTGLTLLANACAAWLAGSENFSVSPRHSILTPKDLGTLDRDSGELWFWGPGFGGP